MKQFPQSFLDKLNSATNKRPATVIQHILKHGYITSEELKDIYVRQTRLNMVRENGDLDLEGEITGYDLTQLAVKENAFASQSKLTITVRVRYSNRTKPEEDFEQSFSAYREFENTQLLQDVQDQLCSEMVEEIADQIYNATVANW